jgi:hypothetical protein
MISSEFLSEHGLIIEQEIIEAVTSLCSALFRQSSLELVVMGQEDCIELAHFF